MSEVSRLLNSALNQLFTYHEDVTVGGLAGVCEKLLLFKNDAPATAFVAGVQVLSSLWSSSSLQIQPLLKQLERILEQDRLIESDRLHASAILNYARGLPYRAIDDWQKIIDHSPDDHPDVMAVKFLFFAHLNLGEFGQLADSFRKVDAQWPIADCLKWEVKAKYAFALEETGQFEEAEKHTLDVLEKEPSCGWALHTLSHACLETGRLDDGLNYFDKHRHAVNFSDLIYGHNNWHASLFHFEKGDFEAALSYYDDVLEPRLHRDSQDLLDLTDTVSLLTRLELEGFGVGDRWHDVYEYCSTVMEQHVCTFVDGHIMLALMASNPTRAESFINGLDVSSRPEPLDQMCKHVLGNEHCHGSDLDDVLPTPSEFAFRDVLQKVGLPLSQGLEAYYSNDYSAAADLFLPIRDQMWRMGGSDAQRDVFELVLINSCILSGVPTHRGRVKTLLYERKAKQPGSELTNRLLAKLLSCHV